MEKDGEGDQAFSPIEQDLPEIHGSKFTCRPEIQEKVTEKGIKTARKQDPEGKDEQMAHPVLPGDPEAQQELGGSI